jgi:predicted CXXCH cytochrome family protein
MLLVLQLFIQPVVAQSTNLPNNSCADCHRKLIFTSEEQRQFIDIRIKHLESGISCSIVCHEDKLNKSIASTYAMWSVSTHALFDITCDDCHGGNKLANSKNEAHAGVSNKTIAREATPEMCGKCHEPELEEFKSSRHFKKLESSEEGPAPACVTCHQAHSVRVLTASEIEDFCSNCHNGITGIDPSVPKKAEAALSSVIELQNEIAKARTSIITSGKGADVNEAETNLESARSVLKGIPSVWHRFNLSYFETEVQKGISDAKAAENLVPEQTQKPETTKSPGFEGFFLISGMIAIYLLKRR